jgi:hypothetical protein
MFADFDSRFLARQSGPRRILLLLPVLLIPVSAPAQIMDAPTAGDTPAAVETLSFVELQAEYERLQTRVEDLQGRAMEDSSLQKQLTDLETAVDIEMTELDPSTPVRQARMTALTAELEAADQAGDQEKLRELIAEGTELQQLDRQVRISAMQSDTIFPKVESFQDGVLTRMTELDPEARVLVDRLTLVVQRLSQGP